MLSVKTDINEVTRWLSDIERRQIPFATRLALKRTARHIAKKTLPRVVKRVFDRPKPWTYNAFYAYQPKGKMLDAYVNIKDGGGLIRQRRGRARVGRPGTPAFKYLRYQIGGGPRRAKGIEKKLRALNILGSSEFVVPAKGFPLDRYGNISGANYSKILADVQGSGYGIAQGFGQATTKRGKKRFFYHPNKRPRGIYQRFGRGQRGIRLALLFVDRPPRYQSRFNFPGIVDRVARKRFPLEFGKAMSQALRTARR